MVAGQAGLDATTRWPSVPEANWADLFDQRVDRCEQMWESNADSGGPDWQDYCAGRGAGYADRLRATYEPVEASWQGYDAD